MRRAAGLLTLVTALAAGQSNVAIRRDRAGNMELRDYGEFVFNQVTADKVSFDVRAASARRPVIGSWLGQGLRFSAARFIGTAVQAAGRKEAYELRTLTATGGVTTTKTAGPPRGAKRVTTIQSPKADYRSAGGEGALTMTGKVTITHRDPSQGQTLVATGSGGTATLDPRATSGLGLRRAKLQGPVTIVLQKSPKMGGGRFEATGSLLTLDNVSKPARLTLTGNVELKGKEGKDIFSAGKHRSATVTLDEQGEMTGLKLVGGGS